MLKVFAQDRFAPLPLSRRRNQAVPIADLSPIHPVPSPRDLRRHADRLPAAEEFDNLPRSLGRDRKLAHGIDVKTRSALASSPAPTAPAKARPLAPGKVQPFRRSPDCRICASSIAASGCVPNPERPRRSEIPAQHVSAPGRILSGRQWHNQSVHDSDIATGAARGSKAGRSSARQGCLAGSPRA